MADAEPQAAFGDEVLRLRLVLGEAAVLPIGDVVRLLHGRTEDVRAWVKKKVRPLAGPVGPLYRWGDVIQAMETADVSTRASRTIPRRERSDEDDLRPRTPAERRKKP